MHVRRKKLIAAAAASAVLLATSCLPPDPSAGQSDPTLGGCPLFPADNYWHSNVRSLAVHPRSGAWVAALGRSNPVHPDFGSGTWQGKPIGFPYVVVDGNQPKVPVSFQYASESEPGPYPLPFDAPVEGGQDDTGDRHVIVVDSTNCTSYELWNARRGPNPGAGWTAGSGAVWNLRSNAMRPAGWTSADAAGLPMLPGLVRYDEVASGDINHAIRFTVGAHARTHIWPARHLNDANTDPNLPPMGAWFRLKASYDISNLPPQAKVVAQAMKDHGIIVADAGASWFLSGASDPRWNNQDLLKLRTITGDAFEAIDASPMMVDPNSAQARVVIPEAVVRALQQQRSRPAPAKRARSRRR